MEDEAPVPEMPEPKRPLRRRSKPVRDARYFYEDRTWRHVPNAIWLVLLIGGLVAVGLMGTGSSGEFLGSANLTAMLKQFLVPALLVPPVVLVVLAGGIDFSVAAVAALTGLLVGSWAPQLGPQDALFRGLGIAAAIGLANGLLVSVAKIHGALVTLATMFVVSGACPLILKERAAAGASAPAPESLGFLASWPDSAVPWIALGVVAVACILLVQLTPFGRRPKAGEVREPVESGLARGFYTTVPYVLSALVAGYVGVYQHVATQPAVGVAGALPTYELAFLVLTAAALGGTPLGGGHGTVLGGLLATLLLIVGGNVAVLKQVPAENLLIAQGAILLGAALLGQVFFGYVAWRFERK
jgi:ribose transport system permease protein